MIGESSALGFRIKSGWATAVLLSSRESPGILLARTIELCDESMPETRQPYHAAMGQLETNQSKIQTRRTIIERVAQQSIKQLVQDCREAGFDVPAAGLVVGSQVNPEGIANPHIRAHAYEGQLFRTVLQTALESLKIQCHLFLEKSLERIASNELCRPVNDIEKVLKDLGRNLQGPWRSEQKQATLAAWVVHAVH